MNSKISTKWKITLPQAVRDFLLVKPGDFISYILKGNQVILTKVKPLEIQYLKSLESNLCEWLSPEDNDAYNNL